MATTSGWIDLFDTSTARNKIGAVLLEEGVPVRASDGGIGHEDGVAQLDDLHAAIERVTGYRIEPWTGHEWSGPAAGEHDATAPVKFAADPEAWKATHRIAFTDATGSVTVDRVMLDTSDDLEGRDGPAYTAAEWDAAEGAAWCVDGGVWLHQGQATPGGTNGTVEVETL